MKALVVYFSASGRTKRTGISLASKLGIDHYEIKPAVLYTREDLNWRNADSRSSVEMKNKEISRPEIIKGDIDLNGYDTILIGFPIWWYTAPTIVNTFLESYDFNNKTVILWATSGSSGLGSSLEDLKKSLPDTATIKEGRMLNNESSIDEFVKQLKAL